MVLALGVGFAVSALVPGRGGGSRPIRNDHIVHVTPVPHANGLIAYLRAATPHGPRTVYVARQDGSGLRQLTPSSLQVGSAAWSPDGTELAFSAPGPEEVNRVENQGIWLIGTDGGDLRRVTGFNSNYDPSWSPDGSMIAFQSDRTGDPGIYMMRSDGANERALIADEPYENTQPAWSPDGAQILFSRIKLRTGFEGPPGDTFHLYAIRPDGSGLHEVIGQGSLDGAWSPDGSKIAYIASGMTGHGGDLMVANADGSDPHMVLACPNGCVGYAGVTWSPDGRELAYWADRAPPVTPSQRGFLYVVDAATGRILRDLSDGTTDDCCPSWQPLEVTSPSPVAAMTRCVVARTSGDFDGDGLTDQAEFVDVLRGDVSCDRGSNVVSRVVVVRFGSGEMLDQPFTDCQSSCAESAFEATDLGDGRDELAIDVGPGAAIDFVEFFRVDSTGISPLVVAEPGDPPNAKLGPALFGGGFDSGVQSPVTCRVNPDGTHELVAVAAELVNETNVTAPWHVHTTTMVLEGEQLVVTSSTDKQESFSMGGSVFQNGCPSSAPATTGG